MSRPTNPLSHFNSYSYYHSLVICGNSLTADNLMRTTSPDVWRQPDSLSEAPRFNMLGKHAPKSVPDESGGGEYIVLIDGVRSADFVIEKASWLSTINAMAVPDDNESSMAMEGEIEIIEPKGVKFLDTLILSALALGVDMSTCTFILKTFFVGYGTHDNSSNFTDIITNVLPLQFRLIDIVGEYTESGGIYRGNIVGVANGTARLPQYSRVGAGMKLLLSNTSDNSGMSLRAAMTALTQKLQEVYDQQYNCLLQSVNQASSEAGLAVSPSDRLAKMHYHITLDPVYDGAEYIVDDSPSAYTITGQCGSGIYVDSGPNSSIETMIINILDKCPKIKEDSSIGTDSPEYPEGTQIQYRIRNTVRTEPADGGLLRYDVYYHIFPYVVARSMAVTETLRTASEDGTGDEFQNMVRNNLIEFDYLYTGNNTDVINFNIKMNTGLAYLQMATQANSFADQLEVVSSRSVHTPSLADEMNRFGRPTQIPVPFNTQLNTKRLMNTEVPATSVQSAYTINKAASLEVANSVMRISGNLHLLDAVNQTSEGSIEESLRMDDRDDYEESGVDTNIRAGVVSEALSNWGKFPAFVKININMPRSNDDAENFATGSFNEKFWYDGYFQITTIENVFDSGKFYQNLQMTAIPTELQPNTEHAGTGDAITQAESFKAQLGSNMSNCYDSNLIANPNANNESIAQPSKRSGESTGDENHDAYIAQPTDPADLGTMIGTAGNGDPSGVPGWNKASKAVQDAIKQASNEYGIDVQLMAAFASKESTFRPNALNAKSKAGGMYQHLPSTWNWLVQAGMIKGIPSSSPKGSTLNMRFDPLWSARGGATYINFIMKDIGSRQPGDVYLGYFAGQGAAKKIVRGISNNPNITLLQAVGDHAHAMQKSNPTIIPSVHSPAANLRNWAQREMNKFMGAGASIPPSGTRPNSPADAMEEGGGNAQVAGDFEPQSIAGMSRTAADALANATDHEVFAAQQEKMQCGTQKIAKDESEENN